MRIGYIFFFCVLITEIIGSQFDSNYLFRRMDFNRSPQCEDQSPVDKPTGKCVEGFKSKGVIYDVAASSLEEINQYSVSIEWQRAFSKKYQSENWKPDSNKGLLFIPPKFVVYSEIHEFLNQNTRLYYKENGMIYSINGANVYSLFPINKRQANWKAILLDDFLLRYDVKLSQKEASKILEESVKRYKPFPSRFARSQVKKVDSQDSLLFFENRIKENYLKFSVQFTEPAKVWGFRANLAYVYEGDIVDAVSKGDELNYFNRFIWLGSSYESIALVQYHISDDGVIVVTNFKVIVYSSSPDDVSMLNWRSENGI